jgi:hypothetical protein
MHRSALDESYTKSAFGPIPDTEEINLALAVVSMRKVLPGNVLRYQGVDLTPHCADGQIYLPRGIEVVVIHALDCSLHLSLSDKLWPLYEAGTTPIKRPPVSARGGLYEQRRYEYLIKKYRQAA